MAKTKRAAAKAAAASENQAFDLDKLDLNTAMFVCDRDVYVVNPDTHEDAVFKAGEPRKLRRTLVPHALALGVRIVE